MAVGPQTTDEPVPDDDVDRLCNRLRAFLRVVPAEVRRDVIATMHMDLDRWERWLRNLGHD